MKIKLRNLTIEADEVDQSMVDNQGAESAVIKHFVSEVLNEVSVVLCPASFIDLTRTEQSDVWKGARFDYNYWTNVNSRSVGIRATYYLVRGSKAVKITKKNEKLLFAHIKKLYDEAPLIAPDVELRKRLERYDRWACMSDDPRVWRSGDYNWNRIKKLCKEVPNARQIWDSVPRVKDVKFPTTREENGLP